MWGDIKGMGWGVVVGGIIMRYEGYREKYVSIGKYFVCYQIP